MKLKFIFLISSSFFLSIKSGLILLIVIFKTISKNDNNTIKILMNISVQVYIYLKIKMRG